MQFAIYASGIPFNGDTVKERSLGGSESAAYYVARALARRGHKVVLFTEDREGGVFDDVTYAWIGERTNESPLGQQWHFYCENTPHDVNIVQRHPGAYVRRYQSKINLFWAHDICTYKNAGVFMAGLWQANRIMPVSNWFKDQMVEVWGPDPDRVTPIHNGVDYSLFEKFELKDNSLRYDKSSATDVDFSQNESLPANHPDATVSTQKPITMFYSSRPERGLKNLVEPGGIMEQLLEKAPHVKLKVCGYDHDVPSMAGFYQSLRQRVEELPNCEHLGALPKEELYRRMCEEFDVWCYPTEFEEVSCITAMEVMSAGMYIFTNRVAALPETIGDYDNATIFALKDEASQNDLYVQRLADFDNVFRRRPRRDYTWEQTTDEIMRIVHECLAERKTYDNVTRHYLRNSDVKAVEHLKERFEHELSDEVLSELELYKFQRTTEEYDAHYADGTEEMYDSPDFKYEEGFVNHPRFQAVLAEIMKLDLPDGARIVDYGCAHGHFTNNLAMVLPKFEFVGVDNSPKALEIAVAKAEEWDLKNVEYVRDNWLGSNETDYDFSDVTVLIAGEVLEHVPDPVEFMDACHGVVGECRVIVTTPLGPWEHASYAKEYPKRFHLHHFEPEDLRELFHHNDDFSMMCLPAGKNVFEELIGWWVTSFNMQLSVAPASPIDYERKYVEAVPRQTVSGCFIVKDGAESLTRLLNSVEPLLDEVVVGVDAATTDDTRDVIERFAQRSLESHRSPQLRVKVIDIKPAVEQGFASARNEVLKHATMDWVLWADADEEMIGVERAFKYLRNNQWRAYGVGQHHFSTEPLGVLSTDYPCRLFRRDDDIRFRGVVHEHPESIHKPNEGVGYAWVIHELHFSHYGYTTEEVRYGRFQRNVALMARDRQEDPDRLLGKFLWIRDLALMCRFELRQNGGNITPEMHVRARRGIEQWEDVVDNHADHPQTRRLITQHLEFYNSLTNILDTGFNFAVKLSSAPGVDSPPIDSVPTMTARFLNKRHLDKFLSIIVENEVQNYGSKYC